MTRQFPGNHIVMSRNYSPRCRLCCKLLLPSCRTSLKNKSKKEILVNDARCSQWEHAITAMNTETRSCWHDSINRGPAGHRQVCSHGGNRLTKSIMELLCEMFFKCIRDRIFYVWWVIRSTFHRRQIKQHGWHSPDPAQWPRLSVCLNIVC